MWEPSCVVPAVRCVGARLCGACCTVCGSPAVWCLLYGVWEPSCLLYGVLPVAAGGSQLDVQRSDAEHLAALGDVLRGEHGGVGRRLVTVSLHLHAAGHAHDRLPTHTAHDGNRLDLHNKSSIGLAASIDDRLHNLHVLIISAHGRWHEGLI